MPLSAELIPQRKTRCLDCTGSTYAPAARAPGKRTLSHDALLTSSAPESVLVRKVWRAEMFAFEFGQTLFEFEHARPQCAPLFELPPHIHSLFPFMPTSWSVRIYVRWQNPTALEAVDFIPSTLPLQCLITLTRMLINNFNYLFYLCYGVFHKFLSSNFRQSLFHSVAMQASLLHS